MIHLYSWLHLCVCQVHCRDFLYQGRCCVAGVETSETSVICIIFCEILLINEHLKHIARIFLLPIKWAPPQMYKD